MLPDVMSGIRTAELPCLVGLARYAARWAAVNIRFRTMSTVNSVSEILHSQRRESETKGTHTPETPSGPMVTLCRTPLPHICDAVVESHTHVCREEEGVWPCGL